jgi:hypothetical protein
VPYAWPIQKAMKAMWNGIRTKTGRTRLQVDLKPYALCCEPAYVV